MYSGISPEKSQLSSKIQVSFEEYLSLKEKLRIEVDDDLLTNSARAKLDYLSACIEKHNDMKIKIAQTKLMTSLNKQQFQAYLKYSQGQKLQKYVQITQKILEHHDTYNYLYGTLDVQGLTFKMWKLRDVKLDKHRGQFILDYLEPDEQEIYNLSDYAVFWVGLQGTKYVFKICAVNEQKVKELYIGDENERTAKKWYSGFQKTLKEQEHKKQKRQSRTGSQINSLMVRRSCSPINSRQSMESFALQDEVIQQQQGRKQSKQLKHLRHSSIEQSDFQKAQAFRKTLDAQKKTFQTQFSKIPDSIKQISPKNENVQILLQQKKEEIIKQQEQEQQQNIIQNKPDEQQQQTIQELHSEKDYKPIYNGQNIRILAHNNNKQRLKMKLSHQTSSYKMLNVLNEFTCYPQWNLYIEQIEILKIFPDFLVIYQKNKKEGITYKERDFIFKRKITSLENCYLQEDESIDFDFEEHLFQKPSGNARRGHIVQAQWGFFFEQQQQSEKKNLIILDLEIDNGGYLTMGQNKNIIINYLKSFESLEIFAQQQILMPEQGFVLNYLRVYKEEQNQSEIMGQIQEFMKNQESMQKKYLEFVKNQQRGESLTGQNLAAIMGMGVTQNEQQQQQKKEKEELDSGTESGSNQEQQISKEENLQFKSYNDENGNLHSLLLGENPQNIEKQVQQIENQSNEKEKESQQQQERESQQQNSIQQEKAKETDVVQKNILLENSVQQLLDIFDELDNQFFKSEQNNDQIEQSVIDKLLKKIDLVDQNQQNKICIQKDIQKQNCNKLEEGFEQQIDFVHPNIMIKMNDFKRDEKKGILLCVNEKKEKLGSRAFNFILKKIGKNLLSGQSLINISLPVFVFDTQSNLERLAMGHGYAPIFLEMAANCSDPVEQMKLAITNQITTVVLQMNMLKPFNPILGETLQGDINGCPIYYEQISHHPPIFSFQLFGRGYKFFGTQQTIADMHTNSITASNRGYQKIKFDNNGTTINTNTCDALIDGTVIGTRNFNLVDKLYCWDMEHDLFAQIQLNCDKKSAFSFRSKKGKGEDYFEGGIYRITPEFKEKFMKKSEKIYDKKCKPSFDGLNMQKDVEKQISSCCGIWHQNIQFDGENYWRLEDQKPYVFKKERLALPSDSNFRKDVNAWRTGNLDLAQQYKEELENIQRADRKYRAKYKNLREKEAKKMKKKNK